MGITWSTGTLAAAQVVIEGLRHDLEAARLTADAARAALAISEREADRWHQEAVAWREAMKPIRTNPALPQKVMEPGEKAEPEREYSQKLMQVIDDEVRFSGDPGVRTWMMAAVDRMLDEKLSQDEIIYAVRQGDSMEVAG